MFGTQVSTRGECEQALADGSRMSALIYRSRAVHPLSPPDLLELNRAAQARNQREGVTGVLLYDNRHFFQWLEGPDDSVERIMGLIHLDRRHTDIKVLAKQTLPTRAFGNWSMKLAAAGDVDNPGQDILAPPRDVVETLRRRPDAAPSVLAKLGSPKAARLGASNLLADIPLQRKTADVLRRVMLAAVVPELALQHSRNPAGPHGARPIHAHPRAKELAELLIGADPVAALALLQDLEGSDALPLLYAALFEPAARILGDLWCDDECSEFDVTLALCRLQSAVHLLGTGHRHSCPHRTHPMVLVAPEPGELHRLGAALDADVLRRAGWSPRCEYPVSDQALQDLVAATWFDALDLSLSAAFTREHRLPHLAATITHARRASRNPALVVLVAGRAFVEHAATALSVGADLATTSSLNVDQSILSMLQPTAAGTLMH